MAPVQKIPKHRTGTGWQPATPPRPLTGGKATDTPVPEGWVRIQAVDDDTLSVLCELGDQFPFVREGYADWEDVDRRGTTSLTSFAGYKPYSIELDVILDDFDGGGTVTAAKRTLEALAGRGPLGTGGSPPQVTVSYSAGGLEGPYVISAIDWDDDQTIRGSGMELVRCAATVTVKQFIADSRLQTLSGKVAKDLARRNARRSYVVKQGENLLTIARDRLGNAGRWTEITELNPGIRDPRRVRAGATIRLP